MDDSEEDVVYVVDRLIAEDEVTSGFGLAKTGKSYFALWMAFCIANGSPYLGLPTKKGTVLFIDCETKPKAWRRRVGKICRGLGCHKPPPGILYLKVKKGSFGNDAAVAKILAVVREMKPRPVLIIIDSFQFATGINPRDEQEVTRVYGYLADFGTVLMLDHQRAPREGDDKLPVDKAFGSVYKTASVDSYFQFTASRGDSNEKRVLIRQIGIRDDEPLQPKGGVARFGVDKRSVVFEALGETEASAAAASATNLDDKVFDRLRAAPGAVYRDVLIKEFGAGVVNVLTELRKAKKVVKDNRGNWSAVRPTGEESSPSPSLGECERESTARYQGATDEWSKLETLDRIIADFMDCLPVGAFALEVAEWDSRLQANKQGILRANISAAAQAERLQLLYNRGLRDLRVLEATFLASDKPRGAPRARDSGV